MNILLSFGSIGYERGLAALVNSSITYFDRIEIYNEDRLFNHTNILRYVPRSFFNSRGFGWWAWKAFLIKEHLKEHKNDIVFYVDALMIFQQSPDEELAKIGQHPVLYHHDRHFQHEYTTKECQKIMASDSDRYLSCRQLNAAFNIWSYQHVDILEEWFKYCTDLECVSDSGKLYPTGKAHRHDQSILTNLATQYNIPTHTGISQFESNSPIVYHHRAK